MVEVEPPRRGTTLPSAPRDAGADGNRAELRLPRTGHEAERGMGVGRRPRWPDYACMITEWGEWKKRVATIPVMVEADAERR